MVKTAPLFVVNLQEEFMCSTKLEAARRIPAKTTYFHNTLQNLFQKKLLL